MEKMNLTNNNNNKEAIAFLLSKNKNICFTDKKYIKELEDRFHNGGSKNPSWNGKNREILREFEDSLKNKKGEISHQIDEIKEVLKYCNILNGSVKFDFSSSKINTFIVTIKNTKDFLCSIYGLNLVRRMIEQNLMKSCIMTVEYLNKTNCSLKLHIY